MKGVKKQEHPPIVFLKLSPSPAINLHYDIITGIKPGRSKLHENNEDFFSKHRNETDQLARR